MPLYSAKELNNIRKSVVLDTVIPCLEKQGFIRAPFLCANFGWDGDGEFRYDLIKLDKNNMMQTISLRFMNARRSIYAAFSMYKLPSDMSMGDLSKINGLSILNEYGTIRRYQYSGHFISIKKLLRCSLTPCSTGFRLGFAWLKCLEPIQIKRLGNKLHRAVSDTGLLAHQWLKHNTPTQLDSDGNPPLLNIPPSVTGFEGDMDLELNKTSTFEGNRVYTTRQMDKLVLETRKTTSDKYGYQQTPYCNWKVKQGYIFVLQCGHVCSTLYVKPLYSDDLLAEISGEKQPKKHTNRWKACSDEAIRMADIRCYHHDFNPYAHPELLTELWETVFRQAEKDIAEFLQLYPEADRFMPDGEFRTKAKTLYLLALVRQGLYDDVLQTIRNAKDATVNRDWKALHRWCKRQKSNCRKNN
mgnify:CR=1 FL=1